MPVRLISIIIPTYNEEKYIASCLDSVLAQDYPKESMEVFVVDGRSKDKTRDIVRQYSKSYPLIHIVDNPRKTVPFAMNKGIKKSKGEYIIRLDAHSTFPKRYVSLLIENAIRYDADNTGGLCITDVKAKTEISLAIKKVLGHRFGVGNSLFRTGAVQPTEVDTVAYGCFKRDVFERYGLFDERLTRNQDIELNKRIGNEGGKIMLIPEIKFTYYARETFYTLMKNNYSNGMWNILTVFYTRSFRSLSIRHFIPLLFVCSLVFPALFSLFYFPLLYVSLLSFLLYISFLLVVSAHVARKSNQKFGYLILAFLTLHFSYGWGSLVGFLKIVTGGR